MAAVAPNRPSSLRRRRPPVASFSLYSSLLFGQQPIASQCVGVACAHPQYLNFTKPISPPLDPRKHLHIYWGKHHTYTHMHYTCIRMQCKYFPVSRTYIYIVGLCGVSTLRTHVHPNHSQNSLSLSLFRTPRSLVNSFHPTAEKGTKTHTPYSSNAFRTSINQQAYLQMCNISMCVCVCDRKSVALHTKHKAPPPQQVAN